MCGFLGLRNFDRRGGGGPTGSGGLSGRCRRGGGDGDGGGGGRELGEYISAGSLRFLVLEAILFPKDARWWSSSAVWPKELSCEIVELIASPEGPSNGPEPGIWRRGVASTVASETIPSEKLLCSDFMKSKSVEMTHEGRIAIAHQAAGRLT